MKETRYFYAPEPLTTPVLTDEESGHALRVLRLTVGDHINVIDGKGNLHQCTITDTKGKRCKFSIDSTECMPREWKRKLSIAVAPTKNIDRIEWFVEKATEIGIDEITFLNCQFSERKVIKTERLEKIILSAVKQSHKFYMPTLSDIQSFRSVVEKPFDGSRYIAHCYEDADLLLDNGTKPLLGKLITQHNDNIQVLVGPEGDFSADEVRFAIQKGFIPISLGTSRLRTETAALVAVHLMRLAAE